MIVYFCGVRPGDLAGHHCVPREGESSPWAGERWHGPLLDWHPDRDGPRYPRREARVAQPEGEFVWHQEDGWTLIAAWDRSADTRGGCSASFAVHALVEPEAMLALAREAHPAVLARIDAHIGRPATVRRWNRADYLAALPWHLRRAL